MCTIARCQYGELLRLPPFCFSLARYRLSSRTRVDEACPSTWRTPNELSYSTSLQVCDETMAAGIGKTLASRDHLRRSFQNTAFPPLGNDVFGGFRVHASKHLVERPSAWISGGKTARNLSREPCGPRRCYSAGVPPYPRVRCSLVRKGSPLEVDGEE